MPILNDYKHTTVRGLGNRQLTPLEEAVAFDFLTHQIRNKEACERLGVKSATLHTIISVAFRRWFDEGLITPGRIENDIKRRLAAQQKETNS